MADMERLGVAGHGLQEAELELRWIKAFATEPFVTLSPLVSHWCGTVLPRALTSPMLFFVLLGTLDFAGRNTFLSAAALLVSANAHEESQKRPDAHCQPFVTGEVAGHDRQ